MSRVLVINGPNLDQLGRRQPEIYGTKTLAELQSDLEGQAGSWGVQLDFYQANDEASIITRLQTLDSLDPPIDGIVINPGSLTHYGLALGDAMASLSQPVVEIHISNVLEREPFRRRSVIPSSYRIYGRGLGGYFWGIRHLLHRLAWKTEVLRYGTLVDQYGDLRVPEGGPGNLAVLVHGGLWEHHWTADTTEAIALDLTRRGWRTCNLEYRRVGLGGGWPETFDDLVTVLSQLPATSGISPENTALIGHSAGATMVLWAAAFHPGPVVAMAPHPDLVKAASDEVWSIPVKRLLGPDSPTPDLYSPQHRSAPRGPTLLAATRDDDVSPLPPIAAYADRFSQVDFEVCKGDHMSFLEPSSSAWGFVASWLETRKATL